MTAAILAVLGLGFLAGGVYRELRGPDAGARGPAVLRYDLQSQLLGRTLNEVAIVPAKPRGLVVLLHARTVRPRLLATVASLGERAPTVLLAAPASGGRYDSHVLVEAIPDARRRFEIDGGVAVGGRGAPALAKLDPAGICAARASVEVRPLVRALADCGRG